MSWLSFTDMGERYPLLDGGNQSTIEGLYLAGDVAATPDIRSALNAGRDLAARIAALPRRSRRPTDVDVLIIGGGPAGVAAALELRRRGKTYLLLERRRLFQALRALGEGRMLYTASKGDPQCRSVLPFDRDCTVRELVERWEEILASDPLEARLGLAVTQMRRRDCFEVETAERTWLADRVIASVGKIPFLRKLDAAEEAAPRIHYAAEGPLPSRERIVVVADCAHPQAAAFATRAAAAGAGNSVVFICEDPPALHDRQEIDPRFHALIDSGGIRLIHGAVRRVERDSVVVTTGPDGGIAEARPEAPAEGLPYDRVYALGGVLKTEVPVPFFRKIGLRFEGEWDRRRWALLALSFVLAAVFYLVKKLHPGVLTVGGRDLAGWYPFLYSATVAIFGIRAIRRYRDPLQTQRLALLIFFQVFFFCALPELILRNWKSYGLLYVWPLVLSPTTLESYLQPDGRFYFWWTLAVSLVGIPLSVLFGGKRYCTYVCGCGGLAETLGDRWRHYSPKGSENTEKERALQWVTAFTLIATLVPLLDWGAGRLLNRALFGAVTPALIGIWDYSVNLALIAIIPIAAYPFLGGKIWCRYWCPVVGFMNWTGRMRGSRAGVAAGAAPATGAPSGRGSFANRALALLRSRFRIDTRRERCIACGMCDRYCEVGVPVMKHALKGVPVTMDSSSCIACGLCVTVCPTDALKFPGIPLYRNPFESRPGW